MATTPSTVQAVMEVQSTTIGDQAPTPAVGSLEIFANQNKTFYTKDSSNVVTPLVSGASTVSNVDGTLTISPTSGAVVASRAAITGDVAITAGSNTSALAVVNLSPGTTGDASHTSTITTVGKGLVTSNTSVSIQITEAQVTNLTTDLAAKQPLDTDLTTIASLTPASGNIMQSVSSAWASQTPVQVMTTLPLATTSLQGVMSSPQFNFLAAANGPYIILVTSNAYSNLKCDGSTDDTSAFNTLLTNAPDGSTLQWPAQNTTMVLTAAAVIPGGKHYNFVGAEDGKTNWLQTSPTADHITCGDWYSTFTGINFLTNNTTTTASQTLTSGTVLTTGTINTALVAASGSITVGSTVGWQVLTYSSRTSSTVTLSSTGTGSSVVGIPLVFKTAGAAVNAGNFVGIDATNCTTVCCFNGYITSGSTANAAIIENWGGLNTINFDIQIDAANWNGIIKNCTGDCTTNSRTLCHLEINQCGAVTGQNNQWIRGQFNMRLGSTTAAYPAGVFSVYFSDSFYDNAGTDAVKVQGISAVQRIKLTTSWLSAAQNGSGLNFASTATTLPTDIELNSCHIYSNSQNGITGAGVQDYKVVGGEVAGNVTSGVNISAAAGSVTSVSLFNVRIGPTGGIGLNGTGIIVAAGTYAALQIRGCDLNGNTTPMTLGAVTVASWPRYSITDNPGYNPHGTVTTPTFPTSTTVVTNTTGLRVTVYMKSGATAPTVTTINGVSTVLPLINQIVSYSLDPGGTIALTFTVAGTWTWVGN